MKLSITPSASLAMDATRASLAAIPGSADQLTGLWFHTTLEMTNDGHDASSVSLSFLIYPNGRLVKVAGKVLRNSLHWDEAILELTLPDGTVWAVGSHLSSEGSIIIDDVEQKN